MKLRFVCLAVVASLAGCDAAPVESEPVLQTNDAMVVCADAETLDGLDVSAYEGDIDWAKVVAAGKSFAFVKATEGVTYVDPTFAKNWAGMTVGSESGDPSSMLELYRQALHLRRATKELGDGPLRWRAETDGDVLAFDRGPGFTCVVNMGSAPERLPPGATVLLTSGALTDDGALPGDTAVWLRP